MARLSLIVRTVTRLLFPFTLLLGIYILVHGHLTPGGGFQGGVIIAAAVVMLFLAYGGDTIRSKLNLLHIKLAESFGAILLCILGLMGVLFGLSFLENVLPLGKLGELFSAGNLPLLNLGIGIKVAAGLTIIFYSITRILGGDSK